MWVTSTGEVFAPSVLKLIVVYLDNLLDLFDLAPRQPKVIRQLDVRFQPELRLAVTAVDMNMHPRLLTGEEEKTVTLFSKYCRAHKANMITQDSLGNAYPRSKHCAHALLYSLPFQGGVAQRTHSFHEIRI